MRRDKAAFGPADPNRNTRRQTVEAADVIPMGMSEHDAGEIIRPVPGRRHLIADGMALGIRRYLPHQPRHCFSMFVEFLAESGVEKQVALRVMNEKCRHCELAIVSKTTTAIGKGRFAFHRPCWQSADRHIRGR